MRPHNPETRRERRLWCWAALICALLLALTALVTVAHGKVRVKRQVIDRLSQVKSICQRYDDYQLGITTKDLQSVINKVRTLSLYAGSEELASPELLAGYARNQDLSGILVLDAQGQVTGSADLDGRDITPLLGHILADRQFSEVLVYPVKVYAEQIELAGRIYDYAIVARQDASRAIVCYSDATLLQGDRYEITLRTMLDLDFLDEGEALVITDGSQVICASVPALEGLAVADCPIVNVVTDDLMSDDKELIELQNGHDTWYGQHDMYRSYYLYAFYSSASVFSRLLPNLIVAAGVCLILVLLFAVYLQYRRKEQLRADAERTALSNAAKTDFLRRMSHDIRTPINGIRGMAEIGLTGKGDGQQAQECFAKILSSSDFLLELVNNVLDMSKLEAGQAETDSEPFDLRDLLRSAQTIIASQAADAGLTLTCLPPEGEHFHLIGSPLNVQRIYQNIMSNAVKYNRPGGTITVSCRETDWDGQRAVFTFVCADSGVGMSPDFQARAFDTFAQEHKTARTTYSGSGLGLAIVKRTVDLLGGTISFVSREGEGTAFTVTLPLTADPDSAADSGKASEAPDKPSPAPDSLQGVRILMAEDNELNCEIATYMLSRQGAEVTAARDGQEALERFSASAPGSFDVILMDVMMPVMDGLESARAIRALDRPDAKTIPIFAVTANAFSDDVAASRESGMNEHLSKPLDFTQVAATIHRYLH